MTGEKGDKKLAQKVLLLEHERICKEIRAIEKNNDKTISFGLSIITAAFAVGFAQKVSLIFFIVPFGIVGVFFYGVLMYTFVFSMGGYKAYLEDRINEVLPEPILMWERLVRIRQRDDMLRPSLIAIYVFIGLILGGLSVAKIWLEIGSTFAIVEAILIAILLIVLVFAINRMLYIQARIYQAACTLAGRDADGAFIAATKPFPLSRRLMRRSR